ncbi:MAG: hypothetical protein ACK2T7_11820, partial [Anaerolineales bacterium]
FFDLEEDDWWASIPAEVIPLRGGIYTAESAEQDRIEHEELVKGRTLGEMNFVEATASQKGLEAYLSIREIDCGLVIDFFSMNVAMLADLDDDGIAELLVKGYRANRSETCVLGTGNYLGAEHMAIIDKDSASETPSVMPISSKE